ncbi:MAG: phosphate/phosphite/phosphonate ABC transporter substrate-binding protein [Proteobacteria bacterium]|nr:phosphate/phosphite/phosphonate ABC transporter substrate-binding protein [Pseudomonadota bacterium]MBU1708472.1 phosphate/phosphite/phosphonate ABC transporter substrate-binding protein [Pseudomonadota bacterium]
MIRFLLTVFLTMTILSACTPQAPTSQEKPTYKIGYMICDSEKETLARFLPLTKYLSKKMGVNFEAVTIDTINFPNEVENLDFTHTNSLLYIMMHRFNGVDILAVEKRGSLGARSKGIIAVLKKSGIKTLSDLKGKNMLFGPMLAPTGFMSQIDILQSGGIDPEKDLVFYTIPRGSFKHEKVIYGVMYEKYDAGAFPFNDFELMSQDGRIDPEDFIILAEGPVIPYCNFAATQKVDESFAKKFKKELLAIRPEDTVEIDGETVKVLSKALIDGFEDITDADFNIVREMAKRTNMPPYQNY